METLQRTIHAFVACSVNLLELMLHFSSEITEHSSPVVLCNPSMSQNLFRSQENLSLSVCILRERWMGTEVFIYREFGVWVEVCSIPEVR